MRPIRRRISLERQNRLPNVVVIPGSVPVQRPDVRSVIRRQRIPQRLHLSAVAPVEGEVAVEQEPVELLPVLGLVLVVVLVGEEAGLAGGGGGGGDVEGCLGEGGGLDGVVGGDCPGCVVGVARDFVLSSAWGFFGREGWLGVMRTLDGCRVGSVQA